MAKLFKRVPELILGFDTETTGLSVETERAISYGFCAYHYGVPQWSKQFFVIPDRPITPGAQRVHGLSIEALEAKRAAHEVYDVTGGVVQALEILREYHERGAFIVGSNVRSFDLEMLRRSSASLVGDSSGGAGFDVTQLRIIDVIEHDLLIEPSRAIRSRRGQDHLCRFYGVSTGGHDALGDARAAVEIFLEQVVRNNAGQVPLDLGGALRDLTPPSVG